MNASAVSKTPATEIGRIHAALQVLPLGPGLAVELHVFDAAAVEPFVSAVTAGILAESGNLSAPHNYVRLSIFISKNLKDLRKRKCYFYGYFRFSACAHA